MKKIIIFLFCVLAMTSFTGCSNSIVKTYPEVAEDFTKEDYKQLKDLSDSESLSYEELCLEYVKANLNDEGNKALESIFKLGEMSNFKCKKEKDNLKFSYDLKFDKGSTTFNFIVNFKDSTIKEINFNNKDLEYVPLSDIFYCIDDDVKEVLYIEDKILNKEYIENKVYEYTDKYIYLPVENDTVRILTSLKDAGGYYQSISSYWKNKLEENEKILQELG